MSWWEWIALSPFIALDLLGVVVAVLLVAR